MSRTPWRRWRWAWTWRYRSPRHRRGPGSVRGVYRRFEIKGEKNDILVIDDYGHHPTEIEATLKAAKDAFGRRVIAVFQPHLYSRTRDFYKEFGSAFYQADLLIVTGIYPAREQPIEGVSGKLVADAARELGHRQVQYIEQRSQVVAELKTTARPGDIIITLGAGDIYKAGEEYLNG